MSESFSVILVLAVDKSFQLFLSPPLNKTYALGVKQTSTAPLTIHMVRLRTI